MVQGRDLKKPYSAMAASQAYRWPSSRPRPCTTGRLMEKPGHATATQRSHEQAAWGEKPGGGGQHTQYIRRLADLRDELLNQEETALARALDRLRLHSINNRDAARYRLKIKDPSGNGEQPGKVGLTTPNGLSTPRPMMTTVEKFRQMRPQRRPPVIFPLQGKQIIETSPTTLNGSSSSLRHTVGEEPTLRSEPTSVRVEETVRTNLQRLIQPTSSIPNIGRKAIRQQESLELKTQSLQNMRNRVYKSTRHHLASPFMTQPAEEHDENGNCHSRPASDGEFQLSPHAYKLGPMTDGDRINMDKLNQYYYICCLPSTPSSRDTDRRSLSLSTPRQKQRPPRAGKLSQRPRRSKSERSSVGRPYHDSGIVVSSDQYSDSETPRHTRYRYSVDAGAERLTLPVIKSNGDSPTSDTHRVNGVDIYLPQHVRSPSPDTTPPDTERKRRHIVIDMPHIIFNAATPDISLDHRADNPSAPAGPGTLSKTLKQNEIRHRELQNLLEDVKELNKRTETLNTQCPTEAPSSVC
ncbi:hypothetical protein BaRGS_00001360 [Batillaria attramentaria]|uniref:Uncharacterized protein n=1 Tax=Batillaria attramentaria TaxID=370345 RepID=A0ABD0M647_9CAEN